MRAQNSPSIRLLVSLGLVFGWLLLTLETYHLAVRTGAALSLNLTAVRTAALGVGASFLLAVIGVLAYLWIPDRSRRTLYLFIHVRERLSWFRWAAAGLVAGVPGALLLFTPLGDLFSAGYIRFTILLLTGTLTAFLITHSEIHALRWTEAVFGVLLTATLFVFAYYLRSVTNYPFSLSWSEGNRLYDYSLLFGRELYQSNAALSMEYGSFGRKLLWGVIYLIPDLPIWAHRLWNAFLSTVPHLALGYLLARWGQFKGAKRWLIGMWIFLFLAQGPIYTPLVISAILLVLTVCSRTTGISILGAALAGYYASLSRWTWLPAPATWAGFLMLAQFRTEKNETLISIARRLIPAVVVSMAGLAGGLLADPRLFRPAKLAGGTSLSQPLLWYRLFPNSTYPAGILLSLVIAALPVVILLIWAVISRRWRLNWIQIAAFAVPSLIFLGGGLIVSVKIGGGNNLHNLDMFLVSLAFLTAIFLRDQKDFHWASAGWLPRLILAAAILIPAWNAIRVGSALNLPPRSETAETLRVVTKQVSQAARNGEVLFIDQRQLLTFHFIEDVLLVPEYEKKYLMDQAMANNAAYFEGFYNDLREKRFAMIVAPPLFLVEKSSANIWGEENNAWLDWVVAPTLCYYKPMRTFTNDAVQLLVPRETPKNCPAGLEPQSDS